MIRFRTADEASLDAFLAVSAASRYQQQLRDYLESLLHQQCTRPEWCVVGFYREAPVARAALWALPDEAEPSDVVLVHADWDKRDAARALMGRVHVLAAELGAEELQHHVDSPPGPPQYQEDDEQRVRLLTESGYELQRNGLRWLYDATAAREPAAPSPLSFRRLPDVGEERFVEALAATYDGTLDSILTRHIEERGLLEAARADFRDYQELDYEPEWWELAYAEDGALAGVIMCARLPSAPVVAHVGVVPAHRGRGLAVQLVRRGTEQLVASGAAEIRGDCDRENVAMVKAFQRGGYQQTARRRTYRKAPVP